MDNAIAPYKAQEKMQAQGNLYLYMGSMDQGLLRLPDGENEQAWPVAPGQRLWRLNQPIIEQVADRILEELKNGS